jgi:hypothetical protein
VGNTRHVRGFVPVCCALAALPVVVAVGHAFHVGWIPTSDDGMIALRSFDVFSGHPPLVGQYSQSSQVVGQPAYSLGPLLYWLLAIPAHLSPRSMPGVMGLVNVACLAGSVALAARRGGWPLAAGTAAALILVARALPVESGFEVWNPWDGLFPFAFLLFLAWSVSCGEWRLLPLLALVASFVVQSHLSYLLPALAATAVAVLGLYLSVRGRHQIGLRRWVAAALVVTAVCWSAPLVDEVTNRPGNITLAYRLATGDHGRLGLQTGLRTAVRAIGVPPWWAEPVRPLSGRVLDPLQTPSAASIASAILLVAVLCALLPVAWRRGRRELAMALALALVLYLSIVVAVAAIPTKVGYQALSYTIEWTVVAGMFVWLTLAWSCLSLVRAFPVAPRRSVAAAALAAVLILSVLTAAGRTYDEQILPPGVKDYGLVDSATDRVRAALAGGRGFQLEVTPGVRNGLTFPSSVLFAARRQGLNIAAPERLVWEMGDAYRGGGSGFDHVLVIRNPEDPLVPGSRLLLRNRAVSVMLKPWSPSPSRSSAR